MTHAPMTIDDAAPGATVAPVQVLLGLVASLRSAGVAATPDRAAAFLRAVACVGAGDRDRVRHAGRATLCAGPDDLELFERAFGAWFDEPPSSFGAAPGVTRAAIQQVALESTAGVEARSGREVTIATAAAAEVLRHRDLAQLEPAETAVLQEMFAQLEVHAPLRKGRRRQAARHGQVDLRRTLRRHLAPGKDPTRIDHSRRRVTQRRVVLVLDVSGSMEPYADSLIRLAHRITQTLPTTETFTVGTRLTKISTALHLRDAESALVQVAGLVPDWSGGTRLGEALQVFTRRWARSGLGRGSVLVIASDGWERGDPGLLADTVHELGLLAHRLVWLNPHAGKDGYQPIQAGIAACLPHLDALVAGHSLAAFAALLERLRRA